MSKPFWTDLVKRLSPYVPGEQRLGSSVIKLNTNENPYPPSAKVLQAIAETSGDLIRRYPDPESVELRSTLAQFHGVSSNQVFVGNGSDEILALAFMAFFTGNKPLQFPQLSYSFYPVYCDLLNIEQRRIAMGNEFHIDMDAFTDNAGGIIFPNPNAPTSLAQPLEAIETLLKRVPNTVVLIDEAYVDFGASSAISLIEKYDNLLVLQTFSKSRSMAGLRLGAAYASANIIEALQRVKNSFNSYPVDAVAQRAGVASILDNDYYEHSVQKIIATRNNTTVALRQRGYTVLDSSANFLFASPSGVSASDLYTILSNSGVLVRYWPTDVLADWLRISIGTDANMNTMLAIMDRAGQS